MAPNSSPTSKPPKKEEAPSATTKRLSELLQEKQEPFVLEVYLLERRYRHPQKKSSTVSSSQCFSMEKSSSWPRRNSSTTGCSSSSSSSTLERRRGRCTVPASFKCSRIAKAILNRVVSVSEIGVEVKTAGTASVLEIENGKKKKMQTSVINKVLPKTEDEESRKEELEDRSQETTSHSSSSTEQIQTRSRSDEVEEAEVVTPTSKEHMNHHSQDNNKEQEHVFQWRTVQENKDCSPVSVLDSLEHAVAVVPVTDYTGTDHFKSKQRLQEFPNKVVTEESLLSASLWELLVRSRNENDNNSCVADLGSNNNTYTQSSQYIINSKKAMQQSRQLMFDCVREAVETTQAKKKQRKDDYNTDQEEKGGGLMCPEEIGKFICDNMMIKSYSRGKQNGEKLTQLIRSELVDSFDEWPPCVYNNRIGKEIGKEVGDRILEDIKDELLLEEMMEYFPIVNDGG